MPAVCAAAAGMAVPAITKPRVADTAVTLAALIADLRGAALAAEDRVLFSDIRVLRLALQP